MSWKWFLVHTKRGVGRQRMINPGYRRVSGHAGGERVDASLLGEMLNYGVVIEKGGLV